MPVYEVRLTAWHCTCPAFAFASFPASSSSVDASTSAVDQNQTKQRCQFGGLARRQIQTQTQTQTQTHHGGGGGAGRGAVQEREVEVEIEIVPPVCKHLLACLLVERAPGLFGGGGGGVEGGYADADADGIASVQQRCVSAVEAAGWAAGWGGL
ncbi:hypothetical protein IWX46DRAFT_613063 [Phyllosticta citricarpa]|uniref:SWIM-type domain-containing protein n=1 Tax=Phyllosticta citricarpa TaxID=55181 RepID=A0ABR1LFX1_9PEZI